MHVQEKLPINTIKDFSKITWEKKDLYNHEPFEEYTDLAYTNLIQTEVYQKPNPMPEWVEEICSHFKRYDIADPSIVKMCAGKILPLHEDVYAKFRKAHNIKDVNNITRYLVFLQKHTPGQLFQLGNTVYSSWEIGSYLSWQGPHSHAVYNMSNVDRIALQITCVRKAS